jgi:hypothetical protein
MQQIEEWLKDLGMPEYAERFAENKIDFSVLPDLTEQHLKVLGAADGRKRAPRVQRYSELQHELVPLSLVQSARPEMSCDRRRPPGAIPGYYPSVPVSHDPMYGPAVRCKGFFVDLVGDGLASMYPASRWSVAPGHQQTSAGEKVATSSIALLLLNSSFVRA